MLQALDLLRDLNASGKRTLPEHVPAGFVKPRWRPHVFPSSGADRRFYELCVLAEVRDRLRAGDIWVTGSRQYRDFETYLIPAATFKAMQKEPLPLDIDTDLSFYLAECRQRLEDILTTVASKARENTLPDVTLADGKLRITPLRKNTPESAEAFAEKAYALMPHIKITELLAEVDQWTSMGDRLVHLRTLLRLRHQDRSHPGVRLYPPKMPLPGEGEPVERSAGVVRHAGGQGEQLRMG